MRVCKQRLTKEFIDYAAGAVDLAKSHGLQMLKSESGVNLFSFDAEKQMFELHTYVDVDRERLVATIRCEKEDANKYITMINRLNERQYEKIEGGWVNDDFATNYITFALYYKV